MRFESTLLSSWSRREWLSIAVIAVTAAFLIGSGTLLLTASSYTATLEEDLGSSASATHYDAHTAAQSAADPDDIVFPLVEYRTDDGERQRVIGVPPDAPARIESASVAWEEAAVPQPPPEGFSGPVATPTQQEVAGETHRVVPHGMSTELFPASWYVGPAAAVTEFGDPGAIVIDPGGSPPQWQLDGVPLIAALPFLLQGVFQIVQTLSVAVLGSGILVLIVVYNVTRMSIRDRREEIRVARSTGISPVRLFGVLVTRVGLLTGTGVVLGFAVGLIATNAVINAATYAGLTVTLNTVVTPAVAWLIAQICGFLLVMGIVAGVLAAIPVIRRDPASISEPDGTRGADSQSRLGQFAVLLRPTFVRWQTVVPTTATLTVFVLIVLLILSIGGAVAPLATTDSGTVIESGAPHPLNSRISEDYATVLRAQNLTASPEVLYAQTRDGEPYFIRGANYSAFAAVSDARLSAGHSPQTADQAVIGENLARTLDISPGETITLGGSVTPGVRRVTIVGTVTGEGITDDQLVIPLETAQGLSTASGSVHLIRTDRASAAFREFESDSGGIVVTGVSGSDTGRAGANYTVTVTGQNLGTDMSTREVTVQLGNRTQTVELRARGSGTARAQVRFTLPAPGTYTVEAGGVSKPLVVSDPQTLVLPSDYPARAPPDTTLLVPAVTQNETPIADATVTLDGRQVITTDQGVAPVRVPPEPGEYTLTVEKEGYTPVTHTLIVDRDAPQELRGRVSVSPSTGTRFTEPTVTVQLANPWGTFFVRNVSLVSPSATETRTAELAGGEIAQVQLSAAEAGLGGEVPPGTYDLRVVSNGTILTTTTYEVNGDRRIAASLASQGEYSGSTGIGRAIENVFGNVRVLFLIIIGLAGLSTVGGTTATFAYAVHTSRRTIGIHRATGAGRGRILRLLLVDAIRIAVPAALVAFALAYGSLRAFAWADLLVVFGIRLLVPLSPFAVGATLAGAVALAAASALCVGVIFVYASPDRLLSAPR